VSGDNEPAERVAWSEWLAARLDAFVAPELAPGSDEASRARTASGIAFFMSSVFAILAMAHLVTGRAQESALNVALALVTFTAPFAMRRRGRYFLVLHATLAACLALLVAIAVRERGSGISAPTVGLAEIPLFATLLAGVRVGSVWTVISCAASAAVGVLAPSPAVRSAAAEHINDHVVLVVVTLTLFLVAALYERGHTRQLARITELDATRHADEIDRLRTVSESRVERAERLASLGRVAAAMAHEINNPLAYVLSNLEFLAGAGIGNEDARVEPLRDAIQGANVVKHIVADLYDFARPATEAGDVADVVKAIEVALKMASPHLRTRAIVETSLPRSQFVRGEAVRLTQVFLNLLVNAAQAMPETSERDSNRVNVELTQVCGEILVEVRDTGRGIPPDVIERVTDEFFTTRPTGQGLGLGLALSHSNVAKMGGRLEFESDPRGTIARVRLVVALAPTPSQETKTEEVTKEAARRLRILVVDDEVALGRSLARLLRTHDVTVVGSGKGALDVLLGQSEFDLVLCDMMMPEVSGIDVYERLSAERPSYLDRVVFMTGGTFTSRAREFQARVGNVFLAKPIDLAVLRDLVSRASVHSRSAVREVAP